MKIVKNLLFVILFFNINVFAQTDTVISKMFGIEDASGKTHLYYQTYSVYYGIEVDSINHDYSHLDADTKNVSLFFRGYTANLKLSSPPFNIFQKNIGGITFKKDNPDSFVIAFNNVFNESNSFFSTPLTGEQNYGNGSLQYIQAFGDSVWANYNSKAILSTDGGKTWPYYYDETQQKNINLLAISPFNRNIFFGLNNGGYLLRSTNQGDESGVVDENAIWNTNSKLYFDADSIHVYGITKFDHHNELFVSDSSGNAGSWNQIRDVENTLVNLAIDDSVSGRIAYSRDNQIFISTDYGNTFSLYAELPQKIYGIYIKPNTDTIYCATQSKIFEIHNNTLTVIKEFKIDKSLELYPMAVGNTWVYYVTGYSYVPFQQQFYRYNRVTALQEVRQADDSVYMRIKVNDSYKYERVDNNAGKVFRYEDEVGPQLVLDLLSQPGDKFNVVAGSINEVNDLQTRFFNKYRDSKEFNFSTDSVTYQKYVQGLGLVQENKISELESSESTLIGCVIDGVVYGDTVTVGVKNEELIPLEFSLEQNYPNPFNPSTIINFSIPQNDFVSIKIYNSIGQEVATLLNKEIAAGKYEISFDGSNLASGIYFYHLNSKVFSATRKMILIK